MHFWQYLHRININVGAVKVDQWDIQLLRQKRQHLVFRQKAKIDQRCTEFSATVFLRA